MANSRNYLLLFCFVAVSATIGCARWKQDVADDRDRRVLAPLDQSSTGTVLEVFFVSFPEAAMDSLEAIWRNADEQKHSTKLRQHLTTQGFRIGTTANPAPVVLEQLLNSKTSGADGTIATLEVEPTVSRKVMSLRFDSPGQILASDVEPRVPLLQFKDGKLRGRDYLQAQGIFSILTTAADGGRISIELKPELHHGQASQKWAGRDGRFVMESSRPKEVFSKLATHSQLAPGDTLLVGGRADSPGSLGQLFFSRDVAGEPQQRLLVIRVKSAAD